MGKTKFVCVIKGQPWHKVMHKLEVDKEIFFNFDNGSGWVVSLPARPIYLYLVRKYPVPTGWEAG